MCTVDKCFPFVWIKMKFKVMSNINIGCQRFHNGTSEDIRHCKTHHKESCGCSERLERVFDDSQEKQTISIYRKDSDNRNIDSRYQMCKIYSVHERRQLRWRRWSLFMSCVIHLTFVFKTVVPHSWPFPTGDRFK